MCHSFWQYGHLIVHHLPVFYSIYTDWKTIHINEAYIHTYIHTIMHAYILDIFRSILMVSLFCNILCKKLNWRSINIYCSWVEPGHSFTLCPCFLHLKHSGNFQSVALMSLAHSACPFCSASFKGNIICRLVASRPWRVGSASWARRNLTISECPASAA